MTKLEPIRYRQTVAVTVPERAAVVQVAVKLGFSNAAVIADGIRRLGAAMGSGSDADARLFALVESLPELDDGTERTETIGIMLDDSTASEAYRIGRIARATMTRVARWAIRVMCSECGGGA